MDKKACKILCAMMMAVLFLLGCADDASYRPEPYKPSMGREETLLGKLEEALGAIPQREPGRDLKGALVACGDGQGAMEDWGLKPTVADDDSAAAPTSKQLRGNQP